MVSAITPGALNQKYGWSVCPLMVRDPALYHRRGQIQTWDNFPEYQHGDFDSLKDFNKEETTDGLRLIDILVRVHSWWIREADVDGFRLDAVKHMGEKAVSRSALESTNTRIASASGTSSPRRAHSGRSCHQSLYGREYCGRRSGASVFRAFVCPRFSALLYTSESLEGHVRAQGSKRWI